MLKCNDFSSLWLHQAKKKMKVQPVVVLCHPNSKRIPWTYCRWSRPCVEWVHCQNIDDTINKVNRYEKKLLKDNLLCILTNLVYIIWYKYITLVQIWEQKAAVYWSNLIKIIAKLYDDAGKPKLRYLVTIVIVLGLGNGTWIDFRGVAHFGFASIINSFCRKFS